MRFSGIDLYRGFVRLLREEEGQAATEYMLVISVLVVAMVGATGAFVDKNGPFLRTFRQLGRNIESIVADPDSAILPSRR